MPRLLIFNADDYGLTPAVSAGILACARGVVRSTTVMANLLTPAEVGELIASAVAAGAHLNLSLGKPVTSFPAALLRADGSFAKARALQPQTWESAEAQAAVHAEWQAQLELLLSQGLALTHIDSHHHVHCFPALFPIALELAARRGLGLRARASQAARCRHRGVRTPGVLIEGYFGKNNISRDNLLRLLDACPGQAVEVMCHPGRTGDLLAERSGYRAEREDELAVLADPSLAELLGARGWCLGSYAELAAD